MKMPAPNATAMQTYLDMHVRKDDTEKIYGLEPWRHLSCWRGDEQVVQQIGDARIPVIERNSAE